MGDKNLVNEDKELAGVAAESPRPALERRELMFRAWDTVKGKWIDGGYGFHIPGEAMLLGGLFCDYGVLELNNIVITQFTGLVDKNGKEIYEGDIIQRHPIHKYGMWAVEFSPDEGCGLNEIDAKSDCEVIGNIYENPDFQELCLVGILEVRLRHES